MMFAESGEASALTELKDYTGEKNMQLQIHHKNPQCGLQLLTSEDM